VSWRAIKIETEQPAPPPSPPSQPTAVVSAKGQATAAAYPAVVPRLPAYVCSLVPPSVTQN